MVNRDRKTKKQEFQPQRSNSKEIEKPTLDLSEIPEEFAELIDEVPKEKREKVTALLLSITQKSLTYRGIVPHPEILRGFNEEVKDGAERTFVMAEKQLAHRIETEKHAVSEQLAQSKRGQWFGFILGVLGLLLSTTLGILGHDVLAGVFATTTIVGLVSIFVIGKKAQQQDLSEKK